MTRKPFARLLAALVVAVSTVPALAGDGSAPTEDFGRRLVDLAIGLGLAVIALFVSLWLAMKAVEMAISMFDKVTEGIDEWEELKKGNVAVGILMAAVILAVGNIISSSVTGLTGALMHPAFEVAFVLKVVVAVINLVIGLWIGTYVIGLAIRILDKMTKNIEEMKEIAKGNVAVAIMVAGVLISVSVVVGQGVEGISKIASVESVAGVVGLDVKKVTEAGK
jgi:uncharacterized membrane protein YjfL (UPF0719 family)